MAKNESKNLITKEDIIRENADKLPALIKAEEKAQKARVQGDKLLKDVIRIVGEIDSKELYKAKGYTSPNKYLEANELPGVSKSTCSQYLNVARNFLLSDNADRKAMFEKLDYNTLAELNTYSDEALKAFCAEHGIKAIAEATSKEFRTEDIRAFKATHEVRDSGKPKQHVIKPFDFNGIVSKPAETAEWYPMESITVDMAGFIESNRIDKATVCKVGKLENGIKDSYAYTALNIDKTAIFYYTAVPHINKPESKLASTKEARKESFKDFLKSMTPEERAEYLASIDD